MATDQAVNLVQSIDVQVPPTTAYKALTSGFRYWWSEFAQGALEAPGDRLHVTFPPGKSYWTFDARRLEPGRRVMIQCVGADHILTEYPDADHQEWLGSTIDWRIEPSSTGCKITMEHIGLTPALVCYDVCEQGWSVYFERSLKDYLNTGSGQPHRL